MDPLISSLLGLAILGGLAGAALVVWLVRALTLERARRRLSMDDLRMLEESTEHLVGSLKDAADSAIRDVDTKVAELRRVAREAEGVLARLELSIQTAPYQDPTRPAPDQVPPPEEPAAREAEEAEPPSELERLAGEGLSAEEIARRLGLGLGEVQLRMGLLHLTLPDRSPEPSREG
jgi:hypothetical protein